MKVKFKKLVDKVLGPSMVRVLPAATPSDVTPIRSILFIRPGGIGDAVLLIPAIHALKETYPAISIDILAEQRNEAVFSLCPGIANVYLYENLRDLIRVFQTRYDVVIDTEQWHRMSAVVARLLAAPVSIGFATNDRKKLFTHPVQYSHDDREMNSFLKLLAPIIGEVTFDPETSFLSVFPELSEQAKTLLQPLSAQKIISIFPGGSIQEKKWGSEKFRQTAKLLIERGYGIAIVGGKEDVRAGEEIARGLSQSLNFCNKLAIAETAAVLKQTSLLITGDSGIMHIGHGLGVKILALFGPGIEKKWAPRGKNCRIINKHLKCSPCTKFAYTPRCKQMVECMKRISVDEVFEKAVALLRQ